MKTQQQPRMVDGSIGIQNRKSIRIKSLIVATWNVRTMLKPGKMKEVADQVLKYRYDIVGIQEIRWQGQGRIDKAEYSLFYSGPQRRTGQYGTGFIISKRMRQSLIEFEAVNERICRVRMRGKFRNITIVNVHAPTEEKDGIIKEQFYDELERTCDRVQRYDMLIVLGDFNAKVGRRECQKGVLGRYSLHEESNDNGILLCQFAARNNVIIKSTCFPHKAIHLGTWKSGVQGVVNQIDHILVNNRYSSSITDVRSCRGPNCDSDHYVVRAVVVEKLAVVRRDEVRKRIWWNTDRLKNLEVVQDYQMELENKLREDEVQGGIDDRWARVERVIMETAEKSIGVKKDQRNEWFDDDCRLAIEEKNTARNKMLQRETRSNFERYVELRTRAHKVCKKKKRDWIQTQFQEIEELNQKNEAKKFYRAIDKMKKNFQPKIFACKNKEGNMITEEQMVLQRWHEYFEEMLNNDMRRERREVTRENPGREEDIEVPTVEEVEDVVCKMKNNRAPGEDNIVAELFKYGGHSVIMEIHKLITEIWETESMPEKWKTGIICPIYKKGDKMRCENYRGITLLNVGYKIFSGVLNERLQRCAEEIIGEYQCGFRRKRSTVDQLFAIRQMMERFYEHDTDLHFLFVDFKQAFDNVNRQELYRVMREFGIVNKLIRLVEMTMKDTRAKVKVINRMTKSFSFSNGVKQGDGLSAVLFNLALHSVIKMVDQKGTIFTKSSQIFGYADDIAIVARNANKVREVYEVMEVEATKIGLNVNESKTKYMIMSKSADRRKPRDLEINGKRFGGVSGFEYLGTTISNDNDIKKCIKERIRYANRAYFANINIFRNKNIRRETKLKIYHSLIRPIVAYGSEVWTMTVEDEKSLRIFERNILRKIYGPVREGENWRIRSNAELQQLIHERDLVKFIKSQRIRWLGHVERMEEDRMNKRMMQGRLYCGRRRGRPRMRWLDEVLKDLMKLGVRGWRERVADRDDWRRIVEKAKAHQGL